MQVEFVFFYFARIFIFGHEICAKYIIPTCMNFFGAFPLPPPTTNHGLSIPKKKLGSLMKKPCITCAPIMRKWRVNLRQPWLTFFRRCRDACVTQKARKIFFLFLFTNHGKEKAKQFMMMLGDHEAAHFVRQVVAVMQFFTKNNANFVKITATWKWLAHTISAILDVTSAARALGCWGREILLILSSLCILNCAETFRDFQGIYFWCLEHAYCSS